MRFVGLVSGLFTKGRRFVSSSASVQEEEVKDPSKLAEIIRQALKRVSDLEAKSGAEGIEFEVAVGTGGATVSLPHGIMGPVRWWVTGWMQQSGVAYPAAAPAIVQDASTTVGTLVLRSYVTGRAIVRVEPAQTDVDPGITVTPPAAPAPLASTYVALAADVTINIAAYATLLTANITTATGTLLNIRWSAAATNAAAASAFYQVLVDGVVTKGCRADIAAAGGTNSGMIIQVAVAPGAHTVLLQWKTNVNATKINAATVVEQHAHLLVQEA